MKAAIYCRVSTGEQDISTQLDVLPNFAKSKGWKIFDIYVDEGISGAATIDARPDFKRLLEDMINQRFKILLVEAHDRVTRTDNLAERGLILQKIKENNIILFSPNEGSCNLSDFAGEITSMVKFVISAEERKNIARRTLKGKKAKLEKGNPMATGARPPYGRKYDKLTGKWSLDEMKAKCIRWAAREYLKGGSARKIAERLRTEHGLKISYDTLLRTFKTGSGNIWKIKLRDGTETKIVITKK